MNRQFTEIRFFSYNGDSFGQLPGQTTTSHSYGRLANYSGQPFVVGGQSSKITEKLNFLGSWEKESDWPFTKYIYNYATVSRNFDDPAIEDHVLIIGGQTGEANGEFLSDRVAKFMDGLQQWSIVGRLNQRRYDHSVVENANNQILVIGGNDLRYVHISFNHFSYNIGNTLVHKYHQYLISLNSEIQKNYFSEKTENIEATSEVHNYTTTTIIHS